MESGEELERRREKKLGQIRWATCQVAKVEASHSIVVVELRGTYGCASQLAFASITFSFSPTAEVCHP